MAVKIDQSKITAQIAQQLADICPFRAFDYDGKIISINAACKACKLCIKKGPLGVAFWEEEQRKKVDKKLWQGIAVYAECRGEKIHPVTLELLGKALELGNKINQQVYALLIGHNVHTQADKLLHYGAHKVFVYDSPELKHFTIRPYTNAFSDFVEKIKPSSVLVGATCIGRSLAPRVAARFQTGLTADCTMLEIHENTDLVQIRPAFGGNIMAQIITTNTRPQFCTVRYKIFSAPHASTSASGEVVEMSLPKEAYETKTEVIAVSEKPKEIDISEAEVIIAVGRGLKNATDLKLIDELAELLNAQIAGTRPLIEKGWLDPRRQIGLSGRTVKPRLIITVGVSGSVQFAAGMRGADYIIAINNDEKASIFDVAHYGIVGNLYEILPRLISGIREGKYEL